jgi:hypothetical protein
MKQRGGRGRGREESVEDGSVAVVILIQLEETGVIVDISCGVFQNRALEWDGMGCSRVLKAEKQR